MVGSLRTNFGRNLPPGVNESMIPGNRPEDMEAEAIAEGWRPRCECGSFLPIHPHRTVVVEKRELCNGKLMYHDYEYEPGTIAILGDEYKGQTYRVGYFSCSDAMDSEYPYGNSGPDDEHEPHYYLIETYIEQIRYCGSCRKQNIELEY